MIDIFTNSIQPVKSTLPTYYDVDWVLLSLVATLVSIGILMVASASMDYASFEYGDPWYLLKRHSMYLLLASVGTAVLVLIPSYIWQQYGWLWLLLSIALLVLVLVPGIGKEVNGSQRWINFGFITMQASEVSKFLLVLFFASYLSRNHQELKESGRASIKPIGILVVICLLLLAETDLGGAIVIAGMVMAMMFIAGVKMWQILLLSFAAVSMIATVAYFDPERLDRLQTFTNPWAVQFAGGYQLTQSLIAFGQGELFGVGLGMSIQKLSYLPDAHTDFIFAIVAEEFGLVGTVGLLIVFAGLIYRILTISKRAMLHKNGFISLATFGVAMLFVSQVFINMGVASGLLPTKGLTMPFISSGGSSLIVCFALIGLVLRLNWELMTQPTKLKESSSSKRSKTSKPRKKVR